jgi:hypothetical protein
MNESEEKCIYDIGRLARMKEITGKIKEKVDEQY